MGLLVLSDDDIALLRFTGDLFFVAESPLVGFDRDAPEPLDYQGSYQSLIDRGVIDAADFRITDDALNQVAPVTECDARIVHLMVDDAGTVTQEDHWLLDEIAVRYERHEQEGGAQHVFGPDLDPHQIVQRLGRHLVPRRAGGDRFDVVLSAGDVVALSLLLAAADAADRRSFTTQEAQEALSRMPVDDAPLAVLPGAARFNLGKRKDVRGPEHIVRALVDKGVLIKDQLGLRLHASLFTLRGLTARRRHTLVRTDFRDDDWLVREVTLLPAEGTLFVVAPTKGGFRIAELDGDALFQVLRDATGPQTMTASPVVPSEPQRLAALLAGQPRRA